MYNGIGLQTPRGSGTNGHVQRNLSFVRLGKKDNTTYKTEADLKRMDALNNRPPNLEILEHERKRKIEIKCIEFQEILEDQDYTPEEIEAKVQSYREKLMSNEQKEEMPRDEFGRVAVRETHQVAAAQKEKNDKLRAAFGISEYFVEGTSFDSDRKAKEELAKSTALQDELNAQREQEAEKSKNYKLVRTPSREKEVEKAEKPSGKKSSSNDEKSKDKKKKKKQEKSKSSKDRRRKRSSSTSSSSSDDHASKKKSSRKRKDSSSDSSDESDADDRAKKSKTSKRHDGKNSSKKSDRDVRKSKKHHKRKNSDDSSDSDSDRKSSRNKRSRKRRHSTSDSSQSDSDSDSSSGSDRKHRKK